MSEKLFYGFGKFVNENKINTFIKDEILDVMQHENEDNDPLRTGCKTKKQDLEENTNKNKLVDEVIDAIFPRIKRPIGILIDVSYNEEISNKLKGNETQEQREKRLLRSRILLMKRRFLKQLEMPNEVQQAAKERSTLQSRLRREKKRAFETPEEAAARRQRHRDAIATARKRIRELETPEQLAERLAKQNDRRKLKNQEMIAKETPEQRAARKERDRIRRRKNRAPFLAMKTGLIRKKTENISNSSEIISKEIQQNLNEQNIFTIS